MLGELIWWLLESSGALGLQGAPIEPSGGGGKGSRLLPDPFLVASTTGADAFVTYNPPGHERMLRRVFRYRRCEAAWRALRGGAEWVTAST